MLMIAPFLPSKCAEEIEDAPAKVNVRPSRIGFPERVPDCSTVVPLPLIVPPVHVKGPVKVSVPEPFKVPWVKLTFPGMLFEELNVTVAPSKLMVPELVKVAPDRLCVQRVRGLPKIAGSLARLYPFAF